MVSPSRPTLTWRAAPAAAALLLLLTSAPPVRAQYFGQNKVQYKDFDFKVMKTRHFDIYYYPEEEAAVADAAKMAERWYTRLSRVLSHQFGSRQPVILYASHTHFEQTNVLSGFIGEGTGGVTELMKRRVVLPMAGPIGETDHVLGHELVHAFQFDMTGGGGPLSTGNVPTAIQLPLWFIEGMAEYLSLGAVDAHTAMWMRDAVATGRMPRVDQLDNPEYFPYRFGQALWAYVAGRWGDEVCARGLRASVRGNSNAEQILESITGLPSKELSKQWHAALQAQYGALLEAKRSPLTYGPAVITEKNAGELNVAPALSPDGSSLAFFSEKDLFSIDLYLADARTGQIRRKLVKTATDPHFQSLQFINSAGSFDPAGRRFVFGAVEGGKAALNVREATGGHVRDYKIPEVDEIFDPSFSPDGRRVVFSAQVGGVTDLFIYDLGAAQLRRLTSDAYADLQPSWSPDGRSIVFSTDRFSTDLQTLRAGHYGLGLIDPNGSDIRALPSFEDAKNIDPNWSADGRSVFFISDRNGISNVYRLDIASGQTSQVTDLLTGASGITALSPALSVGRDRLVYSVYERGQNRIYAVEGARMAGTALSDASDRTRAATLPPRERSGAEVAALRREPTFGLPTNQKTVTEEYKPKLSLDYVGQTTLGVGTGPAGTYIGGGVAFQLSDVLGEHNLSTILQMNGRFEDFGGVIGYENRKHRWTWGAQVSQIPYVTGSFATAQAPNGTLVERAELFRETDRAVESFIAYPFSRASRVELGAAARHISFGREIETSAFDPFTGQLIAQDRQKLDAPSGIAFGEGSAALVYDTALFGPTSPILGQRYRFEVSPTFGGLRYTGVLADYRRYVMPVRPVTLAGRLLHYGRYGPGGMDERITPLFIGYPTLMRGYDVNSFSASECGPDSGTSCPVFDQLVGSRIAVANVELRIPLLGLFNRRNLYGPIPIELIGFSDWGVAWTAEDRARVLGGNGTRSVVKSYGGGARVNLFGFAVVEVDMVKAVDRPQKGWSWIFNFTPGF
jgi:Tol biopolymer transport system component